MFVTQADTYETIRVDAGDTHVFCAVRPGPRPLVCLHGLSGSSAYFLDAFDRSDLADRGLVALDLAGFGLTTAPDGFCFSMQEQASIVVRVIEALGLEAVTLLGHSMGGTIAVYAASELGDRVEGVFVAEGYLQLEPDVWVEQIALVPAEQWPAHFEALQRRAVYFIRGGMLRRKKEAIERVALTLHQTTARAMRESTLSLRATAADPTFYRRYLGLGCRSCYIFGAHHDDAALRRRLEADGARVEIVPRAAHLMMLDNPDAFYAIVSGSGIEADG